MNRTSAWALVGVVAVVIVAILAVLRFYNPVGLLEITIVLYGVIVVLFVVIRRVSKKKQAV